MDRLGMCAAEATPRRTSYELHKLRGKGLIRKVQGRNLYTLTDLGYRVTLSWTKLHQRCLLPVMDGLTMPDPHRLDKSAHPMDRAVCRINAKFDKLARLSCLNMVG